MRRLFPKRRLDTTSCQCCDRFGKNHRNCEREDTDISSQLSDGLNQQSQKTANKIADSSYALTQKSVNDNYIVKVVTVVTVVYLPMQGVAVSHIMLGQGVAN